MQPNTGLAMASRQSSYMSGLQHEVAEHQSRRLLAATNREAKHDVTQIKRCRQEQPIELRESDRVIP